jgi:hypothetical protein
MKELTLEERKNMSVEDVIAWAAENVYATKSESFHVYIRPLYVKQVAAKLENGMYARDHHGHKIFMSVQCASTDEGAEPVMDKPSSIVSEKKRNNILKQVALKLDNGDFALDKRGFRILVPSEDQEEEVLEKIEEKRTVRFVKCEESDPESSRIPILDENGKQKVNKLRIHYRGDGLRCSINGGDVYPRPYEDILSKIKPNPSKSGEVAFEKDYPQFLIGWRHI